MMAFQMILIYQEKQGDHVYIRYLNRMKNSRKNTIKVANSSLKEFKTSIKMLLELNVFFYANLSVLKCGFFIEKL